MKAKPKVSIVTPVYNGDRFIERTIQSVLVQSYSSIEHIIVDGASSDNTMSIVQCYRDFFSRVISEPDNGMYDALNKGFAEATGSIFCYLNSDDILEPDAVALAVEALSLTNGDMCVGNCIFIDEDDHELSRYIGVPLDYNQSLQLCRIPFAQQTAFWTRHLHEQVGGFDAKMRYVGDTKFFYNALRLSGRPPIHVDHYVARFRLHADGFSAKAATSMELEHEQVLADVNVQPGLMRLVQEFRIKWINRWNLLYRFYRRIF